VQVQVQPLQVLELELVEEVKQLLLAVALALLA
jgi:hypothetical protein